MAKIIGINAGTSRRSCITLWQQEGSYGKTESARRR